MASRVLNVALAFVLAGCPHDWAAFERSEIASATDGGPPGVEAGGDANANAAVETFATLAEKPTLLAADAEGIVFVTVEGSVLSCAHASLGCATPGTIASMQHEVRSLAMGHGFVAWAARGDRAVRRASRNPGQGAIEEAIDDDGLVAVGLSASQVYFSVDAVGAIIGTPGIRRCAPGVDCQSPVFGGFADGLVTELKIDGTEAFWLGEGSVFGCSVTACEANGANRVVLANEPTFPFALAVDRERAFYGSSLEGGSIRAVPRAAIAGGGGSPKVLSTGIGAATRLAATAQSVWFTNGAAGTVSRVSKNGGSAVVMASGLAAPSGLAVGGGYVYVACAGDGRILRWKEE